MPDQTSAQELQDRLSLIENMIAEGRHHTESWGWTFILWGAAYYLAMAWSAWGHSPWAWPVTVSAAVVVTAVVIAVKIGHRPHAETTLGRAIGSIWIAVGTSMFLLFLSLGMSGHLTDQHVFVAVISAILGIANAASGLILRWSVQLACALLWWVAAVTTCFGSDMQSTIVFLVAIFLGQIVFGVYCVLSEAQARARRTGLQA